MRIKQWRGNCSFKAAVIWCSCSSREKYCTLESSWKGTGIKIGMSATDSDSLKLSLYVSLSLSDSLKLDPLLCTVLLPELVFCELWPGVWFSPSQSPPP